MEMRTPNEQNEVKETAYYCRGSYYVAVSGGKLIPVYRHAARDHLIIGCGFSRKEADQHLDEVRDYYASHPEEALEIKKRYIREHAGGMSLTEDEITEVALHGWRKIRERDARRWRNGEAMN
jgi:hypothetical protein